MMTYTFALPVVSLHGKTDFNANRVNHNFTILLKRGEEP